MKTTYNVAGEILIAHKPKKAPLITLKEILGITIVVGLFNLTSLILQVINLPHITYILK